MAKRRGFNEDYVRISMFILVMAFAFGVAVAMIIEGAALRNTAEGMEVDTKYVSGSSSKKYGVVYFTSNSCTWCKKMERDTWAHPKVREAMSSYGWYKVDVNKYEQLAKSYGVKNLPATFMIKYSQGQNHLGNTKARVIRKQMGYMGVPRTLVFLIYPPRSTK